MWLSLHLKLNYDSIKINDLEIIVFKFLLFSKIEAVVVQQSSAHIPKSS